MHTETGGWLRQTNVELPDVHVLLLLFIPVPFLANVKTRLSFG